MTVVEMGQYGLCNVSSCTALTVCHYRPLYVPGAVYHLSPVECDPASASLCV